MKKIIKITKRQLNEFETGDFGYWDAENDTHPFDISRITADGYMNDEEFGDRTTTDDFAGPQTPQGFFNRRYGMMTNRMNEQSNQSNDFYDTQGFQNQELNILTNNDDKDNLVKIPQTILSKLKILLDSVRQLNLKPKQQAIILDKFVEELDYDNIPTQWKKELINKIK